MIESHENLLYEVVTRIAEFYGWKKPNIPSGVVRDSVIIGGMALDWLSLNIESLLKKKALPMRGKK